VIWHRVFAFVNFHPALELRLDATGASRAQIRVLNVLENVARMVFERLLVRDAMPWSVRLAAKALNDLTRIVEDRVLVRAREIRV